MDDLISRHAAINVIERNRAYIGHNMERAVGAAFIEILNCVGEDIGRLPSIQLATDKNVGTKLVIDPYKIKRAIRGLTEWQKHVQTESDIDRDISVAVEALKAQLSTDLAELGTDCISRQQAVDALRKMQTYKLFSGDDMLLIDQAGAMTELMLLPPIQPMRGMWEWIEEHGRYECSECGEMADDLIMGYPRWNFCPNCGAKMEVTE